MNLKELRKKHNMTQEQVAQATGVSRSTLIKLQARQFRPSLETIDRLKAVFGEEIDQIDWTPIREPKKRGRKKEEDSQ
jgi:transcriptional regulator with XRE-family HTH domain